MYLGVGVCCLQGRDLFCFCLFLEPSVVRTMNNLDSLVESRQVTVSISFTFLALQVLLFNEDVDAFLQIQIVLQKIQIAIPPHNYLNNGNLRLEPRRQLVQHFANQLRVVQLLSHFHDAHNRRLDEQFSILLDVLVCRLLLYFQFRLQRYVDVDAQLFAVKKSVFRIGYLLIMLTR